MLKPTETLKCFQVLEKTEKILSFSKKIAKFLKFLEKLAKISSFWKKIAKFQFFGNNCKELKALAKFLLLLI